MDALVIDVGGSSVKLWQSVVRAVHGAIKTWVARAIPEKFPPGFL